jgi:hypothetical protein
VLVVVLDAEEEFEWEADFARHTTSVSAIARVDRAQSVFDAFGITPTYVVTYPVANQADGAGPLRDIARSGRACIGAHLHPWVTPPFKEELCSRNSFPGNLPPDLEAAKLRSTVAAIEEHLRVRPLVYQAGRYGLGPSTHAILREQGFLVDCSVLPAFDYRAEGGPDFSALDPHPHWFPGAPDEAARAAAPLLGLPLTAAYVGFLSGGAAGAGPGLYRVATSAPFRALRVPGLLSRIGALERLRLSPEGYTPEDNRRLTRALLERGVRTFAFSFHTPSLKPGCTPYVRSEDDLSAFLDRCRRYFDFFLGELGGVSRTPLELREALTPLRPA